jgi:hypothetical protein
MTTHANPTETINQPSLPERIRNAAIFSGVLTGGAGIELSEVSSALAPASQALVEGLGWATIASGLVAGIAHAVHVRRQAQ